MSKNREVNCTVVNNSGYDLTFIDYAGSQGGVINDAHGSYTTLPVTTISNGQTVTAFAIEKAGGMYGSTGWVSYNLNNNQGTIYFMFNNPYSYEGDGNSGNCWFYAVIQGSGAGGQVGIGSPLSVYAVSNYTINATDPNNQDTMNVTVTLNSN